MNAAVSLHEPPRSVPADRALGAKTTAAAWEVASYSADQAEAWDALVRTARNGVFLFERGYMDYHAERFTDASLMLSQRGELRALLPAHREGRALVSHGGLTFGGLVLHAATGAQDVIEMLSAVAEHARIQGCTRLVCKHVPHIYHRQPSEDEVYALHRLGARVMRVDLSSTVDLARRPPLAKGRRHALSKARRAGITVRASRDLASFWALLGPVLAERHDTTPTHTLAEMKQLVARFAQIELFAAFAHDAPADMLAGALVYRYDGVLHTQYMCASPAGREHGALDAVIAHLIEHECEGLRWFNFGVSTFDAGRQLNAGLVAQKEMFGGRSTVLLTLELDLTEALA